MQTLSAAKWPPQPRTDKVAWSELGISQGRFSYNQLRLLGAQVRGSRHAHRIALDPDNRWHLNLPGGGAAQHSRSWLPHWASVQYARPLPLRQGYHEPFLQASPTGTVRKQWRLNVADKADSCYSMSLNLTHLLK